MSIIDAMVQEFEHESKTTRRVLERVPNDRLSWKPHAKSMSIGALALHIATAPAAVSEWALTPVYEFKGGGNPAPEAESTEQILAAHDQSVKKNRENLVKIGDAGLQGDWKGMGNGKVFMTMPRASLVRGIVLNHIYHHRGQLSVYLRLLGVPVPPIYGPSADESPFG